LDNSGENIAMASLIRSHGFSIVFEFEYISAGSPQYNCVVECAFTTLYGMVSMMLNVTKVPIHLCHGVWPEAAHSSDCVPFLKSFGEMAVVENDQTSGMRAKLADSGKPVMYLGMMPLPEHRNEPSDQQSECHWLHKYYSDFMKLGLDFIQFRLLEHVFSSSWHSSQCCCCSCHLDTSCALGPPFGFWTNHSSSCCPPS
jgi:hypothetical protein